MSRPNPEVPQPSLLLTPGQIGHTISRKRCLGLCLQECLRFNLVAEGLAHAHMCVHWKMHSVYVDLQTELKGNLANHVGGVCNSIVPVGSVDFS